MSEGEIVTTIATDFETDTEVWTEPAYAEGMRLAARVLRERASTYPSADVAIALRQVAAALDEAAEASPRRIR